MPTTIAARAAVLVPGRMYGPYVPLLMYAADAARERGAAVHPLSWQPPARFDPDGGASSHDPAAWVRDQVTPLLDEVTAGGATPVVVAKSLGSYAAALTAERGLPAIWLTPLLRDANVVAALRDAVAPFLLIGGTADPHAWDGGLARELTPHVYEVYGADHGMYVPGPLAASAAVLGLVATAVERFLDTVVWPH